MALAFAPVAVAQSSFTVPPGYQTTEGPDTQSLYVPWNVGTGGRYQWTDGSQRGQPRPNINRLDMRRDGLAPANARWGPRTTTLTVILGHCDLTQLTTTFASNYRGTPTTCVDRMPFNIPDHIAPPASPPAAWTFGVPFTTSFNYSGTADLLWEMLAESTSASGSYPLDAHAGGAGATRGLGTGCNGFQLSQESPLAVSTTTVRLRLFGTGGPATQPAALLVGLADPNTNFGGLLCQRLRAQPDIVVATATNPAGNIGSEAAPWTFDVPGPVAPLAVYTQFLAVDPASTFPLRLRLSTAASTMLLPSVPVSLLWYDGPNPATHSVGVRSGPTPVTRFSY